MRKGSLIIWLFFISVAISSLFWYNEWKYSLPTPVPLNYKHVELGENISIADKLNKDKTKPLFLHFFNPGCPCSKFNISYFKTLASEYSDRVNFAIVVMSNSEYSVKKIQNKFDLQVPVYFDNTIAPSCGVYSTPQAVVIDTDNKLFYRGNYNKSRYCTDKKTEFARSALEALLSQNRKVTFDKLALKAYGCELPNCNK